MRRLVNEMGYHPASNQTTPPTNHPFGSENYKPITYELYLQMRPRVPLAVFVPVGFAELIFGIYKGFVELKRYGLIETLPRMIACEPEAGAPLKKALEQGKPTVSVETREVGLLLHRRFIQQLSRVGGSPRNWRSRAVDFRERNPPGARSAEPGRHLGRPVFCGGFCWRLARLRAGSGSCPNRQHKTPLLVLRITMLERIQCR